MSLLPQHLELVLLKFIEASSIDMALSILERNPGLLIQVVDEVFSKIAENQNNILAKRLVQNRHDLFKQCKRNGIANSIMELKSEENKKKKFTHAIKAILTKNTPEYQLIRFDYPELDTFIDQHFKDTDKVVRYIKEAESYPDSGYKAIDLLEKLLNQLDAKIYPEYWADLKQDLGSIYTDFSTNRRGNLKRSIELYLEALEVFDPSKSPGPYSKICNKLGIAYSELSLYGQNSIETAISYYLKALQNQSKNTYEFSMTQNNLGVAYYRRIKYPYKESLKKAIDCYKSSLNFFSSEFHPSKHAEVLNNLGNAYSEMPEDRMKYLQLAVACYKNALKFRTLEEAPLDYASTITNLGIVYYDMSKKDGKKNIKESLTCFNKALKVLNPENTPEDFALTQHHLGNVYLKNQDIEEKYRIEISIQCQEIALEFFTKDSAPSYYGMCQTALGNAFLLRKKDDRNDNLKKAISHYKNALEVYSSEKSPVHYANCQNNLGTAYMLIENEARDKNIQKSIKCFEEALRFRSIEAFPHNFRGTNKNLGLLYFELEDWKNAIIAFEKAIDAGEKLYKLGSTLESKDLEVVENSDFYQYAAFAAGKLKEGKWKALKILEKSKTRHLLESLRLRPDRPDNIPKDIWLEFENAKEQFLGIQFSSPLSISDKRDSVNEYYARERKAIEVSNNLDFAIENIKRLAPNFFAQFKYTKVHNLLPNENTAFISFCLSSKGSLGFLIYRDNNSKDIFEIIDIPNFTQRDLESLLVKTEGDTLTEGWIGTYLEKTSNFKSEQEKVLLEVGKRLLKPILIKVPSNVNNIFFLPTAGLFLLPLHAARCSKNNYLRICDCYKVSYSPSLEVLAKTQLRSSRSSTKSRFFGIINPSEDSKLVFTSFEGNSISSNFSETSVFYGSKGTVSSVVEGIVGQPYIHFSCHGSYNWTEPMKSGLELADGILSVEDLRTNAIDLSETKIVTLSACETGLTDILGQSPNEYIGLPFGFMSLGIPSVIGSLWKVADLSTALLMEKFYSNHIKEKMESTLALHEAQLWLRRLKISEILDFAKRNLDSTFDEEKRKILKKYINRYQIRFEENPEDKPFSHPYYWAPFTLYGYSIQ
ncbi:MAG: CHAT domain-containing protein [Chitinophagales bacterium]|nr:CHAT domain-containing protein [Chitinophagales bacterium]